jgi:hypothetical protein
MIVAWQLLRVVVPTILVLGVLNALPQFLGGDPLGVVRYDTVERLQQRHRLAVSRAASLPSPWAWPPSRIRVAVGKPDWAEFRFQPDGHGGDALVMCQAFEPDRAQARQPRDGDVPAALLPAGELMQASDLVIAGRPARLRRLLLADGAIVHEVWWRDGGARVMLRLHGTAASLTRIAQRVLGNRS